MQKENASIPDDELDLRLIGRKIYSFFAYPIGLLFSNIIITLVFIALGVLLAVSTKYTIPKAYKSSFIIRPNDPHEKFHVKILTDIPALLSKQDYETVAHELGLSLPVAKTLLGLNVYNPTLKASPDSINYSEVTITTSDYNKFIPIQNSLLQYLENNPYFARLRDLQQRQIAVSVEQVEKDIPQLDSLKKLQLNNYGKQGASAGSQLLLNDLVNPTAIYATSIDRMNLKLSLMAQQAFSNNFQLIKSCVVTKHHAWPPRILIVCFRTVPLFLLLCCLFLVFRDQLKKRRANLSNS